MGTKNIRLATNSSPFFSDWRFQCLLTVSPEKEVVQADRRNALGSPETRGWMPVSENLPKEWNMLPCLLPGIIFVYYVQRDSFIVFKNADVALLLGAGRRADLVKTLMRLYEFPGGELTHDEVLRQLGANGGAEAKAYQDLVEILSFLPADKHATIQGQLTTLQGKYQQEGFVAVQRTESPRLLSQLEKSQNWTRRYNRIRLALEHASLRSEIINREGSDPSLPAISVTNPDILDIEQDDAAGRQTYTSRVRDSLNRLGFDEMVPSSRARHL